MVESDQGHVASRVSVWNGYLRVVGTWEAPDEAGFDTCIRQLPGAAPCIL